MLRVIGSPWGISSLQPRHLYTWKQEPQQDYFNWDGGLNILLGKCLISLFGCSQFPWARVHSTEDTLLT